MATVNPAVQVVPSTTRPSSATTTSASTAASGSSKASTKPRSSSKKHDSDVNPDFVLPSIGNYVFGVTLGQGNFAKVKLAKHKLTGLEVHLNDIEHQYRIDLTNTADFYKTAIKIIDKTQLDEKKLAKLHREVRIMKLLHHPHIVKLYEVIETKHTLFLVMEYVSGGELYDYLVTHGKMKEKDARIKFRQILSAMSYCHKKRVIHRDLKAENLLLDHNLDIKIADFGFSNLFNPSGQLATFCGSPPYAAPELFQGRVYTGPEVDIWSLGVILYVLTTGCLPFDGKDIKEMREVVCRGRYKIPFYLSDNCEKLLRKFLVRDPAKRASLDMLIDDPWVNESFGYSPVDQDIKQDVREDEQIFKIMEEKFHIPREQLAQALQDDICDENTAMYHLLYYEKYYKKGGLLDGVAVDSPANLEIIQIHTPRAATPSVAAMLPIDENSVQESVSHHQPSSATSSAGVTKPSDATTRDSVTRRARPMTWVGGETSVTKYMQEQQRAKNGEDEISSAPGSGSNNATNQGTSNFAVSPSHLSTSTSATRRASALSPPSVSTIKAATDASGRTPNSDDAKRPSTATSNQPTLPAPTPIATSTSRLRRASMIGVFRNPLRRLSELPGGHPQESNSSSIGNTGYNNANQAPGEEKPRSLRFTFNSNTTSTKQPDALIQEILTACSAHGVKARASSRFVVECIWREGMGKDEVKFDVEVCELPRLNGVHGLRFKRLSGGSDNYKDISTNILATIKL